MSVESDNGPRSYALTEIPREAIIELRDVVWAQEMVEALP
jgi:hypothetical protein